MGKSNSKENKVLADIKFVAQLRNDIIQNPQRRADLFAKYDLLCQALENKSFLALITDNKAAYSKLCNQQVILTALYGASVSEISQFTNFESKYTPLVKSMGTNNPFKIGHSLYQTFSEGLKSSGITVAKNVRKKDLDSALNMFGVQSIPNNLKNSSEIQQAIEDSKAIETEEPPVEFEQFSPEDMDELMGLIENEDEPIEITDEQTESVEQEQESETDTDEASEEQEDAKDEEIAKSYEEKIGQYKYFESMITGFIKNMMGTLKALYGSGFSGLPQDGILCSDSEHLNNNGGAILILDRSTGKIKVHKDADWQDDLIFGTLGKEFNSLSRFLVCEENEIIPSTQDLVNSSGICYKLHLAFQTASIKYCKGLISIRHFITEKCGSGSKEEHDKWLDKNNSGNKSSLCVTKLVYEWYEWALKRILYNTMMELYPNAQDIMGQQQSIMSSLSAVTNNIMNVAVVSERKKGINTEVRIATSSIKSLGIAGGQDIADKLASAFNGLASTRLIAEENIAEGVLGVNIIYDMAEANSSVLFASDVIDKLLDSGVKPSWSNCMLGKQPDGQIKYWTGFRDPSKATAPDRAYAIYAGMGSGKGVMTSTLIASALCDGVKVFYTDGKPENGAVIGKLAWEQGKEAYVMDGKEMGSNPFAGRMEDHTVYIDANGNRQQLRTKSMIDDHFNDLPSMFGDPNYFGNESKEPFYKFAGVMRYLKSINLCFDIMLGRAAGKLPMSDDDWHLWVFDEMTALASAEATVRDTFCKYIRDKLQVKGVSRNELTGGNVAVKIAKENMLDPSSEKYDANLAYIEKFRIMSNAIISKLTDVNKIGLRKSNTNLIFIFQKASWLKDEQYNNTLIQDIVKATDCRKIVGKDALELNMGAYGKADAVNSTWYKTYIMQEKYWGISKSADVNSGVDLFKPFQIWTIPFNDNGLLSDEEIEQQEDKARAKNKRYKTKFFKGYVMELAERFNLDIPSILESAYRYASEAIDTLNLYNVGDANSYIYDYTQLVAEAEGLTYEKLISTDGEIQANTGGKRLDIEDDESDEPEEQETQTPEETQLGEEENINGISSEAFNNSVDTSQVDVNDPEISKLLRAYKPHALEVLSNNTQLIPFVGKAKMLRGEKLLEAGYTQEQLILYNSKFNIYGTILKNGFDYTTRAVRNEKNQFALKTAAVYLSNFWVIAAFKGVEVLDDSTDTTQILTYAGIKDVMLSMIGSSQDSDNRYKFLCGMLDDYENEQLALDEMPTEQQMMGYISKYAAEEINERFNAFTDTDVTGEFSGEVNPGAFDYTDQPQDDTGYNQRWENTPDLDAAAESPCYSNAGDIVKIVNPRPTQDISRKDTRNSIVVSTPKLGLSYNLKKKMFEKVTGTAYIFKKYWEEILKAISLAFPDEGLVTNIIINRDNIIVNKKIVDASRIIGGEYDVQLEDIVVIKDLFSKFKSLRILQLDSSIQKLIIYEYGNHETPESERISLMFQEHKSLRTLVLLNGTGDPKDDLIIQREAVLASAAVINKKMGVEKLNMKIAQMAAKNDPKLHKKSPGCVATVWRTGKALSGNEFIKAEELADKSAAKAFGHSLLGIGAMAATGVVTAGTAIVSAPFKIFKMFKKK